MSILEELSSALCGMLMMSPPAFAPLQIQPMCAAVQESETRGRTELRAPRAHLQWAAGGKLHVPDMSHEAGPWNVE